MANRSMGSNLGGRLLCRWNWLSDRAVKCQKRGAGGSCRAGVSKPGTGGAYEVGECLMYVVKPNPIFKALPELTDKQKNIEWLM